MRLFLLFSLANYDVKTQIVLFKLLFFLKKDFIYSGLHTMLHIKTVISDCILDPERYFVVLETFHVVKKTKVVESISKNTLSTLSVINLVLSTYIGGEKKVKQKCFVA